METPTASWIRTIRKRLLEWYHAHRRDMPWRNTSDPYAIWISEVMLQQTRVAAVEPYFRRFLEQLPTVESLAAAKQDRVLKLWEGLGYYSRARNLQKAARVVVEQWACRLPSTAEELQTLPGIGRYTAGAISSIAFGRDEPVVDGNVIRVLCRLTCLDQPTDAPAVIESIWTLMRRLLPKGQAGDFNQAVMELGATVCLPKAPGCGDCPLRRVCRARRDDRQYDLPLRKPKTELPHFTIVAGVIFRPDGKILVDRRPRDGLLGGLWEFPGGKVKPGETKVAALKREVREELNLDIDVDEPMTVVRHAYSHFRITLHAFRCRLAGGRARAIGCEEFRWVSPRRLGRLAFPKANHPILQRIQSEVHE